MPENGFVPLSRKLFRNFLWKEERELSRFEAWLDMIQQAKFATETAMVEGRCLSVRRGDLVASVRYLAQRWRWSRSRVERFLNLLKEQAMIETRTETGVNVITLCNYETYNNPRDTDGTATRTVARQSRDTPETNITRRIRKEGEEGRILPPASANGEELPLDPKPPPKPRARNPLFDALAKATGSDPGQLTKAAARSCAVALAEIAKACPALTPEEIQRRAANYRAHFRGAALTPPALAKHWPLCDNQPKPSHEDAKPSPRAFAQSNDYSRIKSTHNR